MKKYKPTELINDGNKCWRNSLIQALLNCDYFVNQLFQHNTTELGTNIRQIYLSAIKGERPQQPYNIFDNITDQQCVIDYFDKIIENIFEDKTIESVFNIEYKTIIHGCETLQDEQKFNILHWNTNKCDSNQHELNDFIFTHTICEVCKKCKTHDNKKTYSLSKIRPVIAVANANRKTNIPKHIYVKNGTIKYELISAILYSGTGRVGHYKCWINCDGEEYIIDDSIIYSSKLVGQPVLLIYQYANNN